MSTSEIESNVAALLAQFDVTYGVLPRGAQTRDGWECDAWSCRFTKGDGRKAHEEFDYFTGIGHRTKMEDTAQGRLAAVALRGSNRNSLAWEAARKAHCKPVAPGPAGVLHSLILDSSAAEQTFDDWCSDFGYDTDSRKALQTYMACQEQATKMRRIFTGEQINTLREALHDY